MEAICCCSTDRERGLSWSRWESELLWGESEISRLVAWRVAQGAFRYQERLWPKKWTEETGMAEPPEVEEGRTTRALKSRLRSDYSGLTGPAKSTS